jgi:hypothetical protein
VRYDVPSARKACNQGGMAESGEPIDTESWAVRRSINGFLTRSITPPGRTPPPPLPARLEGRILAQTLVERGGAERLFRQALAADDFGETLRRSMVEPGRAGRPLGLCGTRAPRSFAMALRSVQACSGRRLPKPRAHGFLYAELVGMAAAFLRGFRMHVTAEVETVDTRSATPGSRAFIGAEDSTAGSWST